MSYRWKAAMGVAILFFIVFFTISVVALVQEAQSRSERRQQFLFLAHQGEQAHDSLCILAADYDRRAKGDREFLRMHPHGAAGISARTIRRAEAQAILTRNLLLQRLVCK